MDGVGSDHTCEFVVCVCVFEFGFDDHRDISTLEVSFEVLVFLRLLLVRPRLKV